MSTTAAASGSKSFGQFSATGSPHTPPNESGPERFVTSSAVIATGQVIGKVIGGGGAGSPRSTLHQMNQDLPILKPDLLLNDTGLFTVYCFIKNFIGASGTSAVAIDNKIEQAMDLVKSHLMIAVREEVEVLKEKIAELMDRINQLELENTILKANVPQETLSQLSATMQTAATKPPQNTNTSNGPVS